MTLQNDNFIVQGRQTFLWLSAVLLEIYKKKMQRACRIDWLLEWGVLQVQEFLCGILNAVNIDSKYYWNKAKLQSKLKCSYKQWIARSNKLQTATVMTVIVFVK